MLGNQKIHVAAVTVGWNPADNEKNKQRHLTDLL
jgi:hypothetical protein